MSAAESKKVSDQDSKGPCATGRREDIHMSGMLIPYFKQKPLVLFLPGTKQHFIAVFESEQLLYETMQKGKQVFDHIMRIDADASLFLQSLVDCNIGTQIMINAKFNAQGKLNYLHVDPENILFVK